jgi:uncharacterized protein YdhG (YjbR/CyaY superfamily)
MKKSQDVEEFMLKLDHPFKAEVQVLRSMIQGVNKEIEEEIKWNAPSFSYQGAYLVTFNLWERNRIHLVFHNAEIANVRSPLLEGKYDHRRMTYFTGLDDINSKRFAFEKVLKDLIKLQRKKAKPANSAKRSST